MSSSNTASSPSPSTRTTANHRLIGRWLIGDTLGKGGYSWVKRGQDIKTGKTVALKFMEKADAQWSEQQLAQTQTEIDALQLVRHRHVLRLFAYNLSASYTRRDGTAPIDTILLVLEHAAHGELFDILYYNAALSENVARTYLLQLIGGLSACHCAHVVHRDLKPQNLLLDAKYNLKIADFGLSKITAKDTKHRMKTSNVGTKGYRAPELILKKSYSEKCDIFSAGVILFILLAGYPPFAEASTRDKWYRPMAEGNAKKFWRQHRKCAIFQMSAVKDLLTRMLWFDQKRRIGLEGVRAHRWCSSSSSEGGVLSQRELTAVMTRMHSKAKAKKARDVRKMEYLQNSNVEHSSDTQKNEK